MTITIADAITTLFSGKTLACPKFGDHKGGSVTLATPDQRRLLHFLLNADVNKVAEGSDTLFPGLIAAFKNTDDDPALAAMPATAEAGTESWRLCRIQTSGFGGLNLFGGREFDLDVDRQSWCLEGQNGSGKTSLVAAIVWCMTGRRMRDQGGAVEDDGERQSVFDKAGKEIGRWSPLISYPTEIADLAKDATVWVRLTFTDTAGETAVAFRRVDHPVAGDPGYEVTIDPRLTRAPQLLETGLLMPCRLAHIGFGKKSQSLYDAVRMLTGLDQLALIGDGVASQFAHAGRRFLRYAKEHDLDGKQKAFDDNIAVVAKLAASLGIDLSAVSTVETQDVAAKLRVLAAKLSVDAGQYLAALKSDLSSGIDVSTASGRVIVRKAIETARFILDRGAADIEILKALKALTLSDSDEAFKGLSVEIANAEGELATALLWHQRQVTDRKLRLKALASRFFEPLSGDKGDPACPLCDAPLRSDDQRALAREMEELKRNAEVAERQIQDVCAGIETRLRKLVPQALRAHQGVLEGTNPRLDFANAMRAQFVQQPPFGDVLAGAAKLAEAMVSAQTDTLPEFISPPDCLVADPSDPSVVGGVRRVLSGLRRLLALAEWWSGQRGAFLVAWETIVGKADADGKWPEGCLRRHLEGVDRALASAEPFDEAARHLTVAAQAAEKWSQVKEEQALRERVKSALEPLKELRPLVDAEAARSIAHLSGRIQTILENIHLRERLAYRDTSLKKKAVHVFGGFSDALKMDADLVANASWLRAILWAFILALREETVEGLRGNPFPLLVLDDPQTTFDPRNKRKWAEALARLTRLPWTDPQAAQVLLTTYEREFYLQVTEVAQFEGQRGLIAPVDAASGTATIINGNCLERIFKEAEEKSDDAKGREYIRQVRIYVEKLLKHMLRSEGPDIAASNLDKLRRTLKKLREEHVAPFNRKVFGDLLNALGGGRAIALLSDSAHSDDETIGVAEAREVATFWEKPLRSRVHDAFETCANFEAFQGDPRTFTREPTVVALPVGQKEKLAAATLFRTGRAAAAKTDGRAGDGLIMLEEWDKNKLAQVRLFNHELYRLVASTLEPVASVGDFLIVSNYGQINPRNLVIAAVGRSVVARRYNETEAHPEIAILTGQSVDPYAIADPIIVPRHGIDCHKVVGTLFASDLAAPTMAAGCEVEGVADPAVYWERLDQARLFQVKGRSAEPLALDGQFLMTGEAVPAEKAFPRFDGQLVVAVDEDGAMYFKRLRGRRDKLVILESLNPDGTAEAQLLSLEGGGGVPMLTHVLPVRGVLFEIPESGH